MFENNFIKPRISAITISAIVFIRSCPFFADFFEVRWQSYRSKKWTATFEAAIMNLQRFLRSVFLGLTFSSLSLADEKVFGEADLRSFGENLVFNLGSHPVGTILLVDLTITNKTGKDFSVQIRPSCACTQLSTNTLSAASDGKIVFNSEVVLPNEARKFNATLECVDEKSGVSFSVSLVAASVSLSEIIPKRFAFSSKVAQSDLRISVKPISAGYRVEKVSLMSDNLAKVVSSEYSDDGAALSLECFLPKSEDRKQEIFFSVELIDLTSNQKQSSRESITIEYTDRLKIGPSRPVVSVSKEAVSLPIYVISSLEDLILEKATLSLDGGDRKLPLVATALKRRGGVFMLTLVATRDEWDQVAKGESVDSCSLDVDFESGVKTRVKVNVLLVSKKEE